VSKREEKRERERDEKREGEREREREVDFSSRNCVSLKIVEGRNASPYVLFASLTKIFASLSSLREQTSRQVRKVLRDSLIYDSESDGGEGDSRDATSPSSRRRRSAARSRMKRREGSASKASTLAHSRSLSERGGAGGGADSDEDGWREDVVGQGGFVGEHDDERSNTSGGRLDRSRCENTFTD